MIATAIYTASLKDTLKLRVLGSDPAVHGSVGHIYILLICPSTEESKRRDSKRSERFRLGSCFSFPALTLQKLGWCLKKTLYLHITPPDALTPSIKDKKQPMSRDYLFSAHDGVDFPITSHSIHLIPLTPQQDANMCCFIRL